MMTMQKLVSALREEHARAKREAEAIGAALSALMGKETPKRRLSAEGRRRISEAQRARWRATKRQQRRKLGDLVQMPHRRKAA